MESRRNGSCDGIKHSRYDQSYKRKYDRQEIKKMLDSGMSYPDIAKLLGTTKSTINGIVQKEGWQRGWQKPDDGSTAKQIVDNISGYKYVGGYVNAHGSIDIMCEHCGQVFSRRLSAVRTAVRERDSRMDCPLCHWMMIDRYHLKEKQEAKEREAQLKAQRKAEADSRKVNEELTRRLAIHVCKVCGCEFCMATTNYNSTVYCSEECQIKNYRNRHDFKRQKRITGRDHDKGITLKKLYERDHGTCYLCGGQCNWNDKRVDPDGHITVGVTYPSIDHVVALANGGLHKWDNVRLAHMECNALKGDKIMTGTEGDAPNR